MNEFLNAVRAFRADPNPDAADELITYAVQTERDAEAVCDLIRFCLEHPLAAREPMTYIHPVASLLQQAETDEATAYLARHALEILGNLYDRLHRQNDADEEVRETQLFLLQMLALYDAPQLTPRIIAAVQSGMSADSPFWEPVFQFIDVGHPDALKIVQAIPDDALQGVVESGYVELVNRLCAAGLLPQHPLDNPAGWRRLERLIAEESDENPTADLAAAALGFMSSPDSARLLALADEKNDPEVKFQVSVSLTRRGDARGLRALTEWARDPRYSTMAVHHLEELGLQEAIPAECSAPEFVARRELCDWLANEVNFGALPTSLDLIGSRELHWPPCGERITVWLFKIRYEECDDEGVEEIGVVSTHAYSLFDPDCLQMSETDLYAYHCCFESMQEETGHDFEELTVDAGRALLRAAGNRGF